MLYLLNVFYYDNSSGASGNAIDYLVNELQYDKKEAIEKLLLFSGESVNINSNTFSLNDVKFTTDLKRSVSYLSKTRNLDIKIINMLVAENKLMQTELNNNLAFMIYDEKDNIVGAELNTTLSNRRFKGFAKGSNGNYGFSIKNGTNIPRNAFFFESGIDMISFQQFIGEQKFSSIKDSVFVSMGGLKINIIKNIQKIYDNPKIYLCIDNPKFENELQDGSKPVINFLKKIKFKYKFLTPKVCKDWNELLFVTSKNNNYEREDFIKSYSNDELKELDKKKSINDILNNINVKEYNLNVNKKNKNRDIER
jgi:hypothetical protein